MPNLAIFANFEIPRLILPIKFRGLLMIFLQSKQIFFFRWIKFCLSVAGDKFILPVRGRVRGPLEGTGPIASVRK